MAATATAVGATLYSLMGRGRGGVKRGGGVQTAPGTGLNVAAKSQLSTDEPRTSLSDATTYNNFYEFGTDKSDPARNAGTLRPRPWTVAIEGEVARPAVVDIDTLLSWFPLEERVYRMRCVEAWSMVIPWLGFPLADLLRRFGPTSRAKYVAFTTLLDTEQMPRQRRAVLDWPYVEGLRMDEAMHPLTIFVAGLYGRSLPNQNGAPLRLVVPWKYGFKGIKSIVRIRLTETQPCGAARVRLLFECESGGGPSALEPGDRAAHRRIHEATDSPLQRLRGAGRGIVLRHGSAPLLLTRWQPLHAEFNPTPGSSRASSWDR